MAYLFTHEDKAERERLAAIEAGLDPFTIQCLEEIGVSEGWRCLEIGAGGGSITEWLSRRVGPQGKVVATDLQTKFLEAIEATNLEVRKHDISKQEIESGAFDLVSARKVLEHLLDPSAALARLAASVRPGGWLLVEDTDMATIRRFDCPQPQRVERAYLKFAEVMGSAGFQPTYAARLAKELRALGFQDVRYVCPIPGGGEALPADLRDMLHSLGLQVVSLPGSKGPLGWNAAGDNPVDKVYRMTFERLRDRVTKSGLLSADEVEQFFADIRAPAFRAITGIHCAAWGRKPA
ncbi:MAG TPA: methyltransferase domain-containing protein [Pirellulaceae bacterium]|nr:methyltransferase domain-containing protein [Pirellulaceae bacterium]